MPPIDTSGLPHVLVIALTVIGAGFMVCRVIGGLKDLPVFSDYFAAHPQTSLILNAAFSLLTAVSSCILIHFKDGMMSFVECVLLAAGTFFAASGFHRNDKREGPAPPPTGAGLVATQRFTADILKQSASTIPTAPKKGG